MKFMMTKEEFLKMQLLESVKTKQQYEKEKEIITIKEYTMFVDVEGDLPTYEEYIEYYAKESKSFWEMYVQQTAKLGAFQFWLKENKEKTFTYDEIEKKLLELKLSFYGFNGDVNFGGN